MDKPAKILSLMEDYIGHRTYGNLLREYFNESSVCNIDFYWYNEEREIDTKILRRLLSFSFPNQWIRKQNLDFRCFRVQIANANIAKRLAVKKLSQFEYSALHFHSYVPAFLEVDMIKKLPTVVSIDMTCSQAAQEKTDPSFRWTYYPNLFLEKRVYEAAARVVTWSHWAKKSVIEDYNIDAEKVTVVYPGVNLTKLTLSDHSIRDIKKLFNILFVGGDFERKGGHDLLEVFLQTFSEEAELNLVTKASIECQHPHVHIHDNVEAYSPKWLELYRQADVFVMPTHFEAFGLVFIEAMAANLPVIGTCINAIPEIVTHGETGFLIPSGDRRTLAGKIRTLMQNPTLSRQMGAKGRQIVEQTFNAQKNCQTLEGIFREVSVRK